MYLDQGLRYTCDFPCGQSLSLAVQLGSPPRICTSQSRVKFSHLHQPTYISVDAASGCLVNSGPVPYLTQTDQRVLKPNSQLPTPNPKNLVLIHTSGCYGLAGVTPNSPLQPFLWLWFLCMSGCRVLIQRLIKLFQAVGRKGCTAKDKMAKESLHRRYKATFNSGLEKQPQGHASPSRPRCSRNQPIMQMLTLS